MKTTLISLLALLSLAALLIPVKLANSEVYKDLNGISISYRIGAQQNNTDNNYDVEPFSTESNKSALNFFDDSLNMEDWMTDLSAWDTLE